MIWLMVGIFSAGMLVVIILVLRISGQVNQQLNSVTQQLNERLKETSAALQETHKTVGERLDNANRVFGEVSTSLGKLDAASKRVLEMGEDISSLQELLRAPKFRGEIGETFLGNLLAQVFPKKESFQLQYQFKNGDTVDAVIRIGNNFVPVDAKFPLENFKRMIESPNEEEKKSYRKSFLSDVKARINEISSKYILPDEGTYDFALMYIPAENVYYETIIKEDLLDYSLPRKVIPVSPNTFYAYLQVICLGLKGLAIERNAKEILVHLGRLEGDLGKFKEDFVLIGGHLSNAARKYAEAEKRLDRFTDKLISSKDVKQIEAKEEAG
jgi:DNA recombination protein RmuC